MFFVYSDYLTTTVLQFFQKQREANIQIQMITPLRVLHQASSKAETILSSATVFSKRIAVSSPDVIRHCASGSIRPAPRLQCFFIEPALVGQHIHCTLQFLHL